MTTNDRTAIINDRYEIFRRIGRGGMADVFLGRDRLLDRQVAIKVLFPEFAVDPNFVERFRREAQAAANLSHPNIVNVYDWGRHAGTYFIAMEYVEGRTLADILRANGHVTSKQAAEIASEVAAALGFAHEAGLVHRDIKPANILIGSNGQVKVADFGIARAMNAPTESNLTQAGAVMGTATYFSPEQAQGAQPDPRSDLYSLGVVMYEMIAGRPPFTGENPVSIAYKQVHDHPQPLNRLVADVPRPFEAIVAKLLAKDPRIRYSSASALRDDLRRFRNGEPVMALASLSGGRATGATGAATVPLAATAGAATASAAATAAMTSQRTAVNAPVPPPGDRPTGASSAARYYEPRPSRTGWYALAAFFALVALGIGALLLFNALSGGRESGSRTLADYVGRPLTEVTAELDQLELTYTVQAEENNSFGIGVVHRTDPVAGTVVVDGQVITLFFNPEPQLQAVPDVAGQTVEAAIRTLGASGFGVGTQTTETSDEFDEGEVIRTDPPAREQVRQDTAINLVVSSGPERRALPSEVIGLTEERARALLGAAPYEFDVSATTEVSDSVEAGRVIRTDPAPGVLVARGGNVTLVVSRGPAPLTVPDVRGLTEDAARAELAGFDVDTTTRALPAGDSRDGEVITQSLSPGAEAPRGSSIVLEIGAAAEPEPEPDPEPDPAPPAPTTTAAPVATDPPGT